MWTDTLMAKLAEDGGKEKTELEDTDKIKATEGPAPESKDDADKDTKTPEAGDLQVKESKEIKSLLGLGAKKKVLAQKEAGESDEIGEEKTAFNALSLISPSMGLAPAFARAVTPGLGKMFSNAKDIAGAAMNGLNAGVINPVVRAATGSTNPTLGQKARYVLDSLGSESGRSALFNRAQSEISNNPWMLATLLGAPVAAYGGYKMLGGGARRRRDEYED